MIITGGVFMEGDPTRTMQRVSVGDDEIEYSDSGSGEPIVLVHAGVFGDWFLPLSESRVLDGFRVIRVRRAGYGARTPAGHLTLGDHAHHVAAVADRLDLHKIHWVGHSSSCQIGLALAIDRPELVHSLILLEPAAVGGFEVPASAELVRRFAGPAMAAFKAGDAQMAFDTFMRGVCGDGHRAVTEARLGQEGLERAVRDSQFFFRDELPAVLESQFGTAQGSRIRQPVLVVEGGDGARLGPLSGQVTELTKTFLPHAEVVIIPGVNHQLPLQDPETVGRVITTFARQHPIGRSSKA